ncbi:hypothetical protein [Polynucleobacter sp. AP-Sving-400A-A2]|uniref:hypothetical protein n=1 Tax=Polynucleobacter sp. AP-Sving-400A-A2 TaxID=2081049 RepID=UPI001BFDF0AF|nr:hypothetical protein [Polynucleobacter sp. AP-Sving-400A-A2]QWE15354.1 hypothetical protein C2758_04305 [Polynucleobacter sp. AP-Sving-400A-A2]
MSHLEAPKGGKTNGGSGASAAGVNGQIVSGQIGGKSMELLQRACISPLTHLHMHSA